MGCQIATAHADLEVVQATALPLHLPPGEGMQPCHAIKQQQPQVFTVFDNLAMHHSPRHLHDTSLNYLILPQVQLLQLDALRKVPELL